MTCFKRIYGLMKRTGIPFAGIILLLFFCLNFRAEAEIFYSEGSYPVTAGKKFPAQRFAHTEAFNNAVSRAIESILMNTKGKGTFDKSEILKGPFPFVNKEELLERSIDSNGVMKIALKLDIDMNKLYNRLTNEGLQIKEKELYHPERLPKLIIVFGEEIDGKVSKLPYSSQVMHDFLMERNFDVLLDDLIKKDIKNELAIQGMLRGDTRAALNLAHNVGAVIVLSGKLSIDSTRGIGKERASYLTRVSFQAINADSGRIIASVKHSIRDSCGNSERGARECIAKATRETGEQLIHALENEFKGTGIRKSFSKR